MTLPFNWRAVFTRLGLPEDATIPEALDAGWWDNEHQLAGDLEELLAAIDARAREQERRKVWYKMCCYACPGCDALNCGKTGKPIHVDNCPLLKEGSDEAL